MKTFFARMESGPGVPINQGDCVNFDKVITNDGFQYVDGRIQLEPGRKYEAMCGMFANGFNSWAAFNFHTDQGPEEDACQCALTGQHEFATGLASLIKKYDRPCELRVVFEAAMDNGDVEKHTIVLLPQSCWFSLKELP